MIDCSGEMRLTRLAQQLVAQHLQAGGTAIDATVGNGHDTLFLAKTVGRHGKVYGCDIQQTALDQCRQRLAAQGVDGQVCLWLGDHARLAERIPGSQQGKINAIMFNLGYLPGTDKQVITTPDSTVKALQASLCLLSPGGILSVLAYPGHRGGKKELQAVMAWVKTLANDSFETETYGAADSATAPVLFYIRRR